MDCPRCNLRYNTVNRRPMINQCGHTLCQLCSLKILLCPVCQVLLDKTKFTINHSLLQVLQSKKTPQDIDKFVKICFVGQSKVGKTSLITRLKGQQYKENTISTIGYDFAFEDRNIDGLNVRFQLWDSAGQERYRAVSPLHYKNSDIVIIVYDVTEEGMKNNVISWYEQACRHCPENAIKILVGNKIDMLGNVTKSINPLDIKIWDVIAQQKIRNYQVSCKTYQGIQEFWGIIEENVRIILKRIIIQNPFKSNNQIRQNKINQSNSPNNQSKLSKKKKVHQLSHMREKDCSC